MQRRPHFLRREPSVGESAASRSRLRRTVAEPASASDAANSTQRNAMDSPAPDSPPAPPVDAAPHPVQVILRIPDLAKPASPAKAPAQAAFQPPTLAQIPTIPTVPSRKPPTNRLAHESSPRPAAAAPAAAAPAAAAPAAAAPAAATTLPTPVASPAASPAATTANLPTAFTAPLDAVAPSAVAPSAVDSPMPKSTASSRLWERMPEWQRLALQAVVMTSAAVLVVGLFAVWHHSGPVADEAPRKSHRRPPSNKPVLSAPVLARKLSPRAESAASPDEAEESYPVSVPTHRDKTPSVPAVEETLEQPAGEAEPSPNSSSTAPPTYPSSSPDRFQYRPPAGGAASVPPNEPQSPPAVEDRGAVETARLGNIAPLGTGNLR